MSRQPMTVYISGASRELDMLEGYRDRLHRAGLVVLDGWMVEMRRNMAAGIRDTDLSEDAAELAALKDLRAIRQAHYFWLCIPREPTIGAWVELGAAAMVKHPQRILLSGDTRRTIFTRGDQTHRRFATHEDVAAWLEREVA